MKSGNILGDIAQVFFYFFHIYRVLLHVCSSVAAALIKLYYIILYYIRFPCSLKHVQSTLTGYFDLKNRFLVLLETLILHIQKDPFGVTHTLTLTGLYRIDKNR